jgi:Na+-transporting NADH:ubiquinone oxidoreductase subunit NqrB
MDARLYQITVLASLLLYGLLRLDFEVTAPGAAATLASVLLVQWIGTHFAGFPRYEWRSALISGLSLCLLCRTNSMLLCVLTGVCAIAGKFLLRCKGKHLFNPTNFGLVVMMLATDGRVWVSPGQWGNVAFFAFLMACLGGLVVMRAGRADVALGFLFFWSALLIGRSWWVGEPMTIPLHRLQNGALLLFAFFMISDPRTTPDSRAGRLLFAALVAFGGWWWQFRMFGTNGALWSLAFFSLFTPLIDRFLPGEKYQWNKKRRFPTDKFKLSLPNEPQPLASP